MKSHPLPGLVPPRFRRAEVSSGRVPDTRRAEEGDDEEERRGRGTGRGGTRVPVDCSLSASSSLAVCSSMRRRAPLSKAAGECSQADVGEGASPQQCRVVPSAPLLRPCSLASSDERPPASRPRRSAPSSDRHCSEVSPARGKENQPSQPASHHTDDTQTTEDRQTSKGRAMLKSVELDVPRHSRGLPIFAGGAFVIPFRVAFAFRRFTSCVVPVC